MPRLNREFYLKYIKEKLQEGLSANKILETLKQLGVGIRRQDFLSMVREVREEPTTKSAMASIRKDRIISEKHYIQNDSYKRDKYYTIFSVTYIDNATGKENNILVGVYHNELMQRGALENIAINRILQDPNKFQTSGALASDVDILNIKPIKGYTRGF